MAHPTARRSAASDSARHCVRIRNSSSSTPMSGMSSTIRPARNRARQRRQRSERWRSRRKGRSSTLALPSQPTDENLLHGPVRLVLKGPAVLPAPGPVARLRLPAQAGGRGEMQSLDGLARTDNVLDAVAGSVRNGGACARLSQSCTTKLLLLAMSLRSDKSD
jgi:hypothetical protein